ncbi:hypothetical protein K492DRAFT_191162 [Lichtheimia hyalospora FSU 10163]|nr:hypothetical protein K492DRAFT_191162 [Lichtheimia hyalospora FSU 10163]
MIDSQRTQSPAVSSPTTGCPIITSHGTTSPGPAIIAKKRMLKSVSLQAHNLERADQARGEKEATDTLGAEMSQGLLGEIRKMHYLLQQTQDSVNTLQQEKIEHQRQMNTLQKQLKQRADKEEQLNEEIWNLELAKQDLTQQLHDTSHELSRTIAEQKRLAQREVALLHELDRLRTAEHHHNEARNKMRQEYEQEMIAMRKTVSQLKRDNQKLDHEKNSIIHQREQSPPTVLEVQPGLNSKQQQQYEESLKMEIETLQTSLNHAHTCIKELKNQLHAEQMEHANMEKLLQEAQECAASPTFWDHPPASLGDELLQAGNTPTSTENEDIFEHQHDLSMKQWQIVSLESFSNIINESTKTMNDDTTTSDEQEQGVMEGKEESVASLSKNENYGSLLMDPTSYIYAAATRPNEQPLISPARATAFDFDPAYASKHDDSNTDTNNNLVGNILATNTNLVPAVTRTMIGDWMIKYMRKRVGTGMSENKHERFFWVHPYTRTLYWGPKQPGATADNAKSATIVSFRVVPDGLDPPSIVIETRTREIKVRCLNILAHRAWIKALHYLVVEEIPAELQKSLSQSFVQKSSADKKSLDNGSLPFYPISVDATS